MEEEAEFGLLFLGKVVICTEALAVSGTTITTEGDLESRIALRTKNQQL